MQSMLRIWVPVIAIVTLLFTTTAYATSSSITPTTTDYTANDILTSVSSFYDFAVYDSGNMLVGWDGSNLKTYDLSTGLVDDNLGSPSGYSAMKWVSFVTIGPNEDAAWVGFTVSGTNDDRIYEVDIATGTWDHVASLSANFDLEFYNGDAFVSGLNAGWSGGTSSVTSIWLLDTSGSNNHAKVIEVGGNSAGLGIDAGTGDFYYASYNGTYARQLYSWDWTDVQNAISTTTHLTHSDGTKLSDLAGGAYDTDVDDFGNVVFNGNMASGSYSHYLAVWDGTTGSGNNYDVIGYGTSGSGHWFTMIDTVDDVTATGGIIYQADYYIAGIAEIVRN